MIRKTLPSAAFLVVGLFLGYVFWGIPKTTAPVAAPVEQKTAGTFQLMVDYGNDTLTVINDASHTEGQTMLQAVQATLGQKNITLETKEYKGLGSMVTKIGDVENSSSKYWQYWVNGKYPAVGADQYLIKNGDVVEWKFTGARM